MNLDFTIFNSISIKQLSLKFPLKEDGKYLG